ncbi:hypothetical protein IOLA_156 [uncultured bacterium]|nr:hypothetical protein IOLA_156 [uncultured bacterium]
MNINNTNILEVFIPTSKLNININNIIDDFRIYNCNNYNEFINSNNLYIFIFDILIVNPFKDKTIKYLDMIKKFFNKDNISKQVFLNKNNDFIVIIELLSYDFLLDKNVINNIHTNIKNIFFDLYCFYQKDIEIINQISLDNNIYDFIDILLKTCIFQKLGFNINDFCDIFYINKFHDLDLSLSLVKTQYLGLSKTFNINISGASDLLDIKKDVVFIIKNIENNFDKILNFFKYKDYYEENILSFRLKKIVDTKLLNMYEFFNIKLSVFNLILLVKISKNQSIINSLIRVFKLIKSLDISKNILYKKINVSDKTNFKNLFVLINKIERFNIKHQSNDYQISFINDFKNFLLYLVNDYKIYENV